MDEKAVKRAGLLINPSSGKSSGKGLSLVEMLNGNAEISTRVIEKFEQLPGFLDEFAGDGVTDLFISSGDGTIHAIQTELAERKPFKAIPRLSLLPHGTTNMTAADLGFRFRTLQAQADYISIWMQSSCVNVPPCGLSIHAMASRGMACFWEPVQPQKPRCSVSVFSTREA